MGRASARLTTNDRDSFPAWSPDGKQIAFIRPTASGWRVHVMSASGAGQRQLRQAPPAGRPSWTKRGLLIPTNGDLAKIDPRSGHVQKLFGALIDASVGMDATAVSPDLSTVTFVGARPLDPGDNGCGEGVPCPTFALYIQDLRTHKAPRVLVPQWRTGVVLARRKAPRVRGSESARSPGSRERHVEVDQDREALTDDGHSSGLAAALSCEPPVVSVAVR